MNICSPITPDWHMAGQTVIVLDDPVMVRRGYAGREGQIDRLYGEDMPGMAMVALAATVRGEAPDYIVLPLACLSPVRRTPHPDMAD